MKTITGKTCSLRKTCQVCGETYGRKLQISGKGKGYFASKKLFLKTKTCGKVSCKNTMSNRTQAAQRARPVDNDAITRFIL